MYKKFIRLLFRSVEEKKINIHIIREEKTFIPFTAYFAYGAGRKFDTLIVYIKDIDENQKFDDQIWYS